MLKVRDSFFGGSSFPESEGAGAPPIDLVGAFKIVWRQWPLVLAALVVCIMLAVLYLFTATPKYTASARILIDTRKNQLLEKQQVMGDQLVDAGVVESQVEILKSEGVALNVIREQKLGDDPEFVGKSGGLIASLFSVLLGASQEQSEEDRTHAAVAKFMASTAAKRVGLTYVIQVDYTSVSPAKAARVANGIVEAYMVSELEAKYQATKRASKWLQDRIAELRDQATKEEKAVQEFKAANNIIDTGRGLMSEQQLADLNSQLVLARAATAEAKARRDRIAQILASNDIPDATVSDALRNDVITRLRAQYLDLSAREADWAARFGVNHAATQNLRNQMREVRRSIQSEVNRIGETYKSDYEIALAREQSLQHSLDELITQNGAGGEARVKLRDLESAAQTSRNLYDNFLQKYMEATQQQTFPITDARVITEASEPAGKSSPKTLLVIAGGLAAGMMLGLGGALGREMLNNTFHTSGDVERITGHECLGILPRVPSAAIADGRKSGESGIVRYAINSPFSRFTETLRNVKVSADIARLSRDMKVIGVVSSLPKEGKTTVAANLAQVIANTGNRTLLIDADLRNPFLTRALSPKSQVGLLQVLSQRMPLSAAVQKDIVPNLHFLPAVIPSRVSNTSEILASRAMTQLLADAREEYEYVLVDFAPIGPVVDVKASSHLIDGFVFVVEWGKTSHDAVLEALGAIYHFREHLLGIILNRADASVLKRHENYKGRNYHHYYLDSPEKVG